MIIVEDPPGYLPAEIEGLEEIPLVVCPIQPGRLQSYAANWEESCSTVCLEDNPDGACGTENGDLCHVRTAHQSA